MAYFVSPIEIERMAERVGHFCVGTSAECDLNDAMEIAREEVADDPKHFETGRPFRDGGEFWFEVRGTPLFDYMLEGAGFDIWWDARRSEYSLNATLKAAARTLEFQTVYGPTVQKIRENISEWCIYWPKSKRVRDFQQRVEEWVEALVDSPSDRDHRCTRASAISQIERMVEDTISIHVQTEAARDYVRAKIAKYLAIWPGDERLDQCKVSLTLDMIERERITEWDRVVYRKVV